MIIITIVNRYFFNTLYFYYVALLPPKSFCFIGINRVFFIKKKACFPCRETSLLIVLYLLAAGAGATAITIPLSSV